MTELLGKDAILSAADLPTEDIDVPEWGGIVRVQGMSGEQRDAFEASIQTIKDDGTTRLNPVDFRAKFAARVIVDESGSRIFSGMDVHELSKKSAKALQRVFDAGQKLSGMSDDDVASLEGNSDGQNDASTIA